MQGLFLAWALSGANNKNKRANRVLVLILLLTVYVLAGRIIIGNRIAMHVFRWIAFSDAIIFLFGPLNYLYIRRLIVKSSKVYRLSFLHFLPTIVCSSIFFVMQTLDRSTYAELYYNGYLKWIFNGFEFIGLFGNIAYLLLSFHLLKKYNAEEKNSLSNPQPFYDYLKYYLSIIAICLGLWLISYLNVYYFGRFLSFVSYDSIWIAVPFFIYMIGYFSLKQPELFRITKEIRKKIRTQRLSESEIKRLKLSIKEMVSTQQIFKDSDLTLGQLAAKIDASQNDVSWLLNNEFKTTFYDFINQYRVQAFVDKVHQNQHLNQTILALAMDVGFKSKSTFNKAFKQFMQITPSSYIKSLNMDSKVA